MELSDHQKEVVDIIATAVREHLYEQVINEVNSMIENGKGIDEIIPAILTIIKGKDV